MLPTLMTKRLVLREIVSSDAPDLARRLWGRGLATEAMRAVLDHGFDVLRLNRVEAHTEAANTASIRMLRRLGFWQEGTFHDRIFDNGAYHDVALFVLLARDIHR